MAVKYRFSKDFDYSIPDQRATVAYKNGMELLIPEAHADAADKASAGERMNSDKSGAGDAGQSAGGAAAEQGSV